MGLAGKARRHKKKMQSKRSAKAAKRALYLSLKGTSSKKKKMRARTRTGAGPWKHTHLVDHCGNIGCARCYPQYQRAILNGRVVEQKTVAA